MESPDILPAVLRTGSVLLPPVGELYRFNAPHSRRVILPGSICILHSGIQCIGLYHTPNQLMDQYPICRQRALPLEDTGHLHSRHVIVPASELWTADLRQDIGRFIQPFHVCRWRLAASHNSLARRTGYFRTGIE